MLIDCVPIKNYIFSLLHTMTRIGTKILNAYFEWISKIIEIIADDELYLINQRDVVIKENNTLKNE